MNILTKQYIPFEDLNVYTRTIIVSTNIQIHIKNFFNNLKITPCKVIEKKKGRKPKSYKKEKPQKIENNSIIFMKNELNIRGVNPKDPSNKKKGYFRNSVGMIIYIKDKLINVKVSQTGKFHMTGCTSKKYALYTIISIWNHISSDKSIYTFNSKKYTCLQIILKPIMCNMNFGLNIKIDREELDKYFNLNTGFVSTLESDGHTGVNVKIPIKNPDMEQINDYYEIYKNDLFKKIQAKESPLYIENKKKNNKKMYNTFLVFQSGQIIMSGRDLSLMKNAYYSFLDCLHKAYPTILENIQC